MEIQVVTGTGFGFCWTKREALRTRNWGGAHPPQDLTFVHPSRGVPAEGCPGAEATWGLLFGASTSSSPQPQHSHLVIQQLLSHLDANSRSAATVRAGIVEVLSEAAVIAATGSVGKGAWVTA